MTMRRNGKRRCFRVDRGGPRRELEPFAPLDVDAVMATQKERRLRPSDVSIDGRAVVVTYPMGCFRLDGRTAAGARHLAGRLMDYVIARPVMTTFGSIDDMIRGVTGHDTRGADATMQRS